ncbi:NAD(P)-binding protein [Wallemia mellicola]|uniref:Very-long-chain 3-oxoacyl-CoA reductase n=1 Tax=Wallemia mellicola TaxID=1708541 RepID=A0AB38MZ08_9BASI|nr:NAD(P)-binding protein [Wallemia mellicola]TIC19403.1 NAD(P)-binding protein [Wallemia mellicola]TIC70288.1 NAD(P)-binding protein [Wallemia mellicola]
MIQDCLDKISEFYNLTIDHTLTTKASNTPTFTLAFALLGATVAGITLLRLLRLFFDVTIRKGISLKKFGAGKGTWAVVTGATDGIGREFAFQLAKAGFNIVLASRSAEKLGAVAADLESKYNIKTKTQSIDFSAGDDSSYDALSNSIDGLNIGVLVNNVGKSHEMPVPFEQTPLDELKAIVEININATLRVTQAVLPKLIERKNGLILNIGSFAGTVPTPLLATYTGSKSFLLSWTQALGEEVKSKGVTVELVNTYFVVSSMSKIRRPSKLIPLPATYVRSVLTRIGLNGGSISRPYTSTPYWSHAIVDAILSLSGFKRLVLWYTHKMQKDIRQRALRKKEREAKKQ